MQWGYVLGHQNAPKPLAAESWPRTPLGAEYTALPKPPSCIWGCRFAVGERRREGIRGFCLPHVLGGGGYTPLIITAVWNVATGIEPHMSWWRLNEDDVINTIKATASFGLINVNSCIGTWQCMILRHTINKWSFYNLLLAVTCYIYENLTCSNITVLEQPTTDARVSLVFWVTCCSNSMK